MKPLLNAFLLLTTLLCAFAANAVSQVGVVTHVLTYTNSDLILVKLDNMPEHPSCKADYFAIDPKIPADRRHQVLARLLTAFATGKKTNITYHVEGDCVQGYMRLYRVG